jgi:hypothetical protein
MRARLLSVAIVVIVSGNIALASDGVIELSQTCAVNTGCLSLDGPGFPIDIRSSGSYVLTSNLDTTALGDPEVDVIAVIADDVTIDLNGFQILGPVECAGGPPAEPRICSPQNLIDGQGIDSAQRGTTVRNGTIRGMPGGGVQCGVGCRVENVTVMDTAGTGISVETGGVVTNCVANGNHFSGISAGSGATGSVIQGSTAIGNGTAGIFATRTTVRGNTAAHNRGEGIFTNTGSTVIENAISNNNENGVRLGSSLAIHNTIRDNVLFGIEAVGDSGYGGNLIEGNGGTVTGGAAAVEVGENICDGDTTCP